MRQLSILIFLSLLLLRTEDVQAQFDFGVKLGIHSFDLDSPSDIIFPNQSGSIAFKEAKLGFQGGIYTKITLGKIFLEPRMMLHSTKVDYTFDGENGSVTSNILEEEFTNLDIPFLIGIKPLFFDVYGGPVAHINISSTSDLIDFDDYDEMFSTANYGFRFGVGLNIGNINVGLEYEGNFSSFGDHINIGGQRFSFDDKPNRFLLNLGIAIF